MEHSAGRQKEMSFHMYKESNPRTVAAYSSGILINIKYSIS